MTKSASTIHPVALAALVAALVGLLLFVGGPAARTRTVQLDDNAVKSSDASPRGEGATESEKTSPARIRLAGWQVGGEQRYPDGILEDPLFNSLLSTVKGRLVDEQGRVLSGLRVELQALVPFLMKKALGDSKRRGLPWERASTFTDTEGRFEVQGLWAGGQRKSFLFSAGVGSGWLFHRWMGSSLESDALRVAAGSVHDLGDVAMWRTGSITGLVLDKEGRPVEGALVTACEVDDIEDALAANPFHSVQGGIWIVRMEAGFAVDEREFDTSKLELRELTTRTAANGRYTISELKGGAVSVNAQVPGAFFPLEQIAQCEPGATSELPAFHLASGHQVSGVVVDHEGNPVQGAEVLVGIHHSAQLWLFGKPVATGTLVVRIGHSDAKGLFNIRGFPRSRVTLAARKPGQTWSILTDGPVAGEHRIQLAASFDLVFAIRDSRASLVEEIDARLTPSDVATKERTSFSAKFLREVPLSGRFVSLGAGRFKVSGLPPGRYGVRLRSKSGEVAILDIEHLEQQQLAVQLGKPELLRIEVVDGNNRPVQHARVRLGLRTTCWTDQAGEADVDVAGEREPYSVAVEHPAFSPSFVEVQKDQGMLRVKLRRLCVVKGKIIEENSIVDFSGWQISFESVEEDEDSPPETLPFGNVQASGAFQVVFPSAGEYGNAYCTNSLGHLAHASVGEKREESIKVQEGSNPPMQIFVDWKDFPALAKLHGQLSIDGKMAKGALIVASTEESKKAAVRSGDDGYFDLGNILSVEASGALSAELELQVFSPRMPGSGSEKIWTGVLNKTEQPGAKLNIAIHTSRLAGMILRPDGTPARQLWVSLKGELDPQPGFKHCSYLGGRRSDERGCFAFQQLATGKYRLRISEDHLWAELRDLKLAPGTETPALRVRLDKTVDITGKVDLSELGIEGVVEMDLAISGHVFGNPRVSNRRFVQDNLPEGGYRFTLYAAGKGGQKRLKLTMDLQVSKSSAAKLMLIFGAAYQGQIREQANAMKHPSVQAYLEACGLKMIPKMWKD